MHQAPSTGPRSIDLEVWLARGRLGRLLIVQARLDSPLSLISYLFLLLLLLYL